MPLTVLAEAPLVKQKQSEAVANVNFSLRIRHIPKEKFRSGRKACWPLASADARKRHRRFWALTDL